jgi:hypothetical protein
MFLIITLGALVTVHIAADDELTSRDKFLMVIALGVILGVTSLFV